MVTKTVQEIDEMRQQIAAGELSPDAIDQYYIDERKNVFGQDHKLDARGRPIEQGVGSKGHETRNHFAALQRAEQMGQEPAGAYDRAIAELRKRDSKRAQALGLVA